MHCFRTCSSIHTIGADFLGALSANEKMRTAQWARFTLEYQLSPPIVLLGNIAESYSVYCVTVVVCPSVHLYLSSVTGMSGRGRLKLLDWIITDD